MPKEMIYGEGLPYGEDDPGRSVVEVRWSRETGYFQIATKCVHAADESDYHPPLEPIEAFAITEASGVDASISSANTGVLLEAEGLALSGHYTDLDRAGINDLIRVLRRARDQAFGRDE